MSQTDFHCWGTKEEASVCYSGRISNVNMHPFCPRTPSIREGRCLFVRRVQAFACGCICFAWKALTNVRQSRCSKKRNIPTRRVAPPRHEQNELARVRGVHAHNSPEPLLRCLILLGLRNAPPPPHGAGGRRPGRMAVEVWEEVKNEKA